MKKRLRLFQIVAVAGALVMLAATLQQLPSARAVDADADGDGVIDLAEQITGSDPDDPASSPEDAGLSFVLGLPWCFDEVDNDLDGLTDAADPGCADSDGDIVSDPMEALLGSDPFDAASFPEDSRLDDLGTFIGQPLFVCADGFDNDGDGLYDLEDPDCDAPPAANDNLANHVSIATIPFSDVPVSTKQATTEPGEQTTLNCEGQIQVTFGKTVWYRFTPSANAVLAVDASTNDYGAVPAVYSGPPSSPTFAGLIFVGCDGSGRFTFSATAGTTYYFQIGACCPGGGGATSCSTSSKCFLRARPAIQYARTVSTTTPTSTPTATIPDARQQKGRLSPIPVSTASTTIATVSRTAPIRAARRWRGHSARRLVLTASITTSMGSPTVPTLAAS